ncbi:SRPBCC family protein [Streptomyces sparsogenes]|uniref:Activator of Hsp90 ATPase 1 family protein n=1 Tax=Streptomyces sparsogenes DSM 40356 TaxID=1331668 RepID=A0A1R1SQC5_9ACTN|nr:SRPBCC family protein [Streptomyces sparsogenes]OMI40453.1 Activator of Hsp90 ATPase 1 family protein [Streptomyces sparsogenes DSM 40356]
MKDTLSSTEGGRSALRLERRIARPPEEVWRALTEPALMARWFPAEVRLEARVGGRMDFVFPGQDVPDTQGTVTELDPPRVFAFTWGADQLRWELRPEGDGCALTLTHTFRDRFGAASFASGWHTCVSALATLVEGVEPGGPAGTADPGDTAGPAGPADMAELHERYVEAFGLAEGVVEAAEDGWRLRFERQLVRPVETVWQALTGPSGTGEPVVGGPVPIGFRTDAVPPGPVADVAPPRELSYDWLRGGHPAGRVRWRLTDGTGHGARLILTQTGPPEAGEERDAALAAWRKHIALLAAKLLYARG